MSKTARLAIILLVLALVGVGAFFYLKKNSSGEPPVDDSQVFLSKVEHFDLLEEIALDSMKRPADTLSKQRYLKRLKKTSLNDWAECVNLMDEAQKLKLDDENERLRKSLHQYASQRIQQTILYIKAEEAGTRIYDNSIDSIEFEISLLKEKIKKDRPVEGKGSLENHL